MNLEEYSNTLFTFIFRYMSDQLVMIPMDVYESPQEMVIILPLGGVAKKSVKISIEGHHLKLSAERKQPKIKATLMSQQEQCFRGVFEREISLPAQAAVDRIVSELSPENILTIIIPKIVRTDSVLVNVL